MIIDCCAVCAPGPARPKNQDNLYINGVFRENFSDNTPFRYSDRVSNRGLYAVADGMGTEKHGALAALIAVQAMDTIRLSDLTGRSMACYLIGRNAVICDMMKENGEICIGSTFAGLAINGGNACAVNIGNSRIYLLRGRRLTQLSHDHTTVLQEPDTGVAAEGPGYRHDEGRRLTQHLGVIPGEFDIEPHIVSFPLVDNDLLLLCSDGLTDMLDDSCISRVLETSASMDRKVETLYESALRNGGKDDVTILLLKVKKEV